MAIRKILVPMTGLAADATALEAAFAVAGAHAAHVQAAFLRFDQRYDRPKFPERLTKGLFDELAAIVNHEDEEVEQAGEEFEAAREASGIPVAGPGQSPEGPSARWLGFRPAERILRDARLADMVVLGRLPHDDRRLAALRGTVLSTSGRPLLLSPPLPPTSFDGPVAIAWNGGTDAARAVSSALPFLTRAGSVHVLTAKTRKTRSSEGERLAEFLVWHGITPQVSVLTETEEVGALLLRRAEQIGARLLVMGGQSQTRLREFLFGGVTSYVFEHAGLPVLIAH